jgi:hypothetical protein
MGENHLEAVINLRQRDEGLHGCLPEAALGKRRTDIGDQTKDSRLFAEFVIENSRGRITRDVQTRTRLYG